MTTGQFRARQLRNRRGERIDAGMSAYLHKRSPRKVAMARMGWWSLLFAAGTGGQIRTIGSALKRMQVAMSTRTTPSNLDRGAPLRPRFHLSWTTRDRKRADESLTLMAARPHGGAMRLGRQRPDYHEAVRACRPSTCSRGRCSAFGGRRHTGASRGGGF